MGAAEAMPKLDAAITAATIAVPMREKLFMVTPFHF
jgi:hypothetical protein